MNSITHPKILICTYAVLPDQTATALRISIFIKMLLGLGYKPTIITMNSSNLEGDENIKYWSFRNYKTNSILSFLNYFLYGIKLKEKLLNEDFDIIFNCGMPFPAFLFIKRYSKKNAIRLVFDVIDWYSSRQFRLSFFSLPYIFTNLTIKYFIDRNIRVIAISQYLVKFFKAKNISTAYIPFVIESSPAIYSKKHVHDNSIVFVYAGNPGNKDLLYPFFDGMSFLLDDELKKIEVRLYGVNDSYLNKYKCVKPAEFERIKARVQLYGYVNRREVITAYESVDFSILLRDSSARYAKAGFPTKVSESLSLATPVFCNLSSDLDLYLRDKENAMIIADMSGITVCNKIREILSLSIQERKRMNENALRTALDLLKPSYYLNQLESILQ